MNLNKLDQNYKNTDIAKTAFVLATNSHTKSCDNDALLLPLLEP